MILFIAGLVISSAWCFGVFAVFDSKHLLGRLGSFIERIIGTNLCRPLFLCPTCMGSVHGLLSGFIYFGLSIKILPFMICLAGVNFVILSFMPDEL